MATCRNPRCQAEYEPNQESGFCVECGDPLDPPATVAPAAMSTPAPLEPQPAPRPVMSTGPAAGGTRVDIHDETKTAGRDVIIHQERVEYCDIGGLRIEGGRVFRCPQCKRSPVCDQHFDVTRMVCIKCIEEQLVSCALCTERVPPNGTFTCQRCHRVAGNKHLDPAKNWCDECVSGWQQHINSLNDDNVVIAEGGVAVEKSNVELVNGQLRTGDGERVAELKENIWYARSAKQWHTIRPPCCNGNAMPCTGFIPT